MTRTAAAVILIGIAVAALITISAFGTGLTDIADQLRGLSSGGAQ